MRESIDGASFAQAMIHAAASLNLQKQQINPNSYFFNFNERFHNCIKSDFSRIWKCTGSGNRNRIQGKYVYHISADGTCKRSAAPAWL